MARQLQSAVHFLYAAEKEMKARGLASITIEYDFDELIALGLSKKGIDVRHFSSANFPMMSQRGFWVRGRDASGETVLFMACRLEIDLIAGGTLADHIADLWPRLGGGIPILDESVTHTVSGRVVYHGGLWIKKSLRKNDLGTWATRYGLILAYLEWNPDAVYGTANKFLALNPYGLSQFYAHGEPFALQWEETSPDDRPLDYWLFVARKNQIERVLKNFIRTGKVAEYDPLKHSMQTGDARLRPPAELPDDMCPKGPRIDQ